MFKWMFRMGFLVVFLALCLFFFASYHIVQTKDGIHLIRKSELSLKKPFIDTRDWGITDYLKEKNITKELSKIKIEQFKDSVSEKWKELVEDFEDFSEELDLDQTSDTIKKEFEKVRKIAETKFNNLKSKWENGELDFPDFQKKVNELREWTKKEYRELKKRIAD